MDLGVLFRRRTDVSRKFLGLLFEGKYLRENERPSDIYLSYLISLILGKGLSTPFEVLQIISQVYETPSGAAVAGASTTIRTSTSKHFIPNYKTLIEILKKGRGFLFLKSLIVSSVLDATKKKILWSGWLIDCISLIPNILVENIVFSTLLRLECWWNRSAYLPRSIGISTPSSPQLRPTRAASPTSASPKPQKSHIVAFSAFAKFIATLVTYPFDVLRTRQIIHSFTSLSSSLSQGSSAAPLDNSPPTLRQAYQDVYEDVRTLKFGGGLLAGLVRACLYVFMKDKFLSILKKYSKYVPREDEPSDQPDEFTFSLILDYWSGAFAELFVLPLTLIIRKTQISSAFKTQEQGGFWKYLAEMKNTKSLKQLFTGFQYQVISTLLIWFGTMFFFNIYRSLVSLTKKYLADSDAKKKPPFNALPPRRL